MDLGGTKAQTPKTGGVAKVSSQSGGLVEGKNSRGHMRGGTVSQKK